MLAGFARRQLPKNVHGLCLLCDKIVLSQGGYKGKQPPKVHRRCLLDWHGPHAGVAELASQSRRGTPLKRESLQLSWAWTIRHKLGGESLDEIARDLDNVAYILAIDPDETITKQAVFNRIQYVVSHLPEPELVGHRLRQQIRLIRGGDTDLG
jgi:hypothetical protein